MTLEEIKKAINHPLPQSTLCLLITDSNVLLAMKKRGFGTGKWNGVGGKVNPGENVKDAAIRETQEEIGVTPLKLKQAATINFFHVNSNGEKGFDQEVNVFICTEWKGVPIESEEMNPEWFPFVNIPYKDMWEDDKHWMPRVLDGEKIKADFLFVDGKIADYKIS